MFNKALGIDFLGFRHALKSTGKLAFFQQGLCLGVAGWRWVELIP